VLPSLPRLLLTLALAAGIAASTRPCAAQGIPADTLRADPLAADTVQTPVGVAPVGLPGAAPAGATTREGRLEHPVTFTARDSLVIVFGTGDDPAGDVGTLYGEARAAYDTASLTAAEIDLLFGAETLRARGAPGDTAAAGRPAFQRGSEAFTGRELAFNLATGRGRVIGARTAIEDGYLVGGVVKQAGPRVTFAQDVVYTTCEYEEHAHWGLHAHRMKVVDGEWVYTGPAQLRLLGIPTPLWLPFGFFPAAEGRRSGPLPPDYGEQADLGFYLRGLGYYWALSDYMDLQLRGGLYTSGSYEADGQWRYARRYLYDGGLTLGFRAERRGEPQDPGFQTNREVSLGWRHAQTFDAAGTARLSGNVDLRSSGFARTAAADFQQRVTQQTNSRITFSKRWASGRNVTASYSQNLNLSEGSTNVTLPSVAFNQPRWFPFRPAGSRGRRWYEQVGVQYTGSLDNRYAFRPLPEGQLPPEGAGISWLDGLLSYDQFRTATGADERFITSARHAVPISGRVSVRQLPVLGALQLDVAPSLNYQEDWYFRRNAPVLDGAGFVVRDTLGAPRFTTEGAFAPVRQATLAVTASTQAFGTFPWRIGRLDGFRHVLRPNLSFSFSPDTEGTFWGRQRTYTEPDGTEVAFRARNDVALPGRERRTLGIALANVLQTRIAREDTAGAVSRRVVQLLSFDANTGYDFAADSLRWGNVAVNARSTIAEQVSVNVSALYSPYAVDGVGRTRNELYFDGTGRPLRFVRANLNASTQLRGRSGERGADLTAPRRRPPLYPDLAAPGPDGLAPYDFRRSDLGFVDFQIPWSLNLDFNYGLTRNFAAGDDQRIATLDGTFDLGITPTWRVSGRSGYDLARGEITPTQLSILRDLHCWEMAVTWLPFGQVRAFTFSLYVKSGNLRDLLRLDVPNVDRTRYF